MSQFHQATRIHLTHLVISKQYSLQRKGLIQDVREGFEPVSNRNTQSTQTQVRQANLLNHCTCAPLPTVYEPQSEEAKLRDNNVKRFVAKTMTITYFSY